MATARALDGELAFSQSLVAVLSVTGCPHLLDPTRLSAMATRDEPQYLYLTTTGRRTRLPREIEIWYTQRSGRYYVISEQHDRAQWIRNLLADPRVRWRVGNVTFSGRARVVEPAAEPELAEAVQNCSRHKYGWGEGLIVELAPDRTN